MLSKTFFSNTTNRQIQLFELLSQSSKLSSKQDLLDQLQITERTLKKDIETLNHLISFVQLSEVEDSIQLKFKNDGSILDVYRFFIGKSLSLSLIKKIFLRENYKTSELAQELLTSETTIYRLIRNLNTIFKEKKLDITILTNPFMITGNERQIRYFISTLYLSQLKINNDNYSRWVFVDAMITLIHSNQLNQALSFYNYYDTEVYVYVNTVRFYNGHLIPEIELTNRGLVFYQYLQEFNYEHLNHNFGQITINKDNLVQLTFPYFNNQHNFIYTENDYITLLSQNSSEEEVILQQLSEILDTLSDEFNISIYNRQYLLSQLYNLIIHHYAYGRSFSILFDSYKLIKEKFKRINPEFFDRSHELVKNFALRLIDQYPTENYYELYYGIVDVLYTVWHNLLGQLIIDDRKVDVLIHNSLSPKLCWFIFDVLKTECSYEAQYNIHSSHLPLTEDLVNQYDLVITDEWMNIEDSQKIFHLVHLYKNFTKDVQERLLNIRMSWIQ